MGKAPQDTITEHGIQPLPEPFARYFRYSGVIGRARISAAHIQHSGTFKAGIGKPWTPIRGEYFLTTSPPSFVWYGRIRILPGLAVAAIDSYANGRGRMWIRLLSLFTIADVQSSETTQSAFARCIAELTMAPTFFLDPNHIVCRQTGPNSFRCSATNVGLSADVDFLVNDNGALERITTLRYFDRGTAPATLERFTVVFSKPSSYAGVTLASHIDAFWNLPDGDFHSASFDLDAVTFE